MKSNRMNWKVVLSGMYVALVGFAPIVHGQTCCEYTANSSMSTGTCRPNPKPSPYSHCVASKVAPGCFVGSKIFAGQTVTCPQANVDTCNGGYAGKGCQELTITNVVADAFCVNNKCARVSAN